MLQAPYWIPPKPSWMRHGSSQAAEGALAAWVGSHPSQTSAHKTWSISDAQGSTSFTWRKWRGCDYCLERCTVRSGGQSSHSAQLQHCRVLFRMTFLAGLITVFHAGCFPGMIYSHSAWAQSSISLSSWALPPAAPSRCSAVFDNSIGDYAFVWAAKNNLGHFPYHFLIILIPQPYIKIINHIEISVLTSKSCEEVSKLVSNARAVV